ncbi:MAG: SDR family NAD(P)-dependent oxidoreductase [Cyanobacteria bacterium P01_E01_bin.35]
MTNIENKKVLIAGVSFRFRSRFSPGNFSTGWSCCWHSARYQSQIAKFKALSPGHALAIEMDIINPVQVQAGVEKASANLGQIDKLANHAGYSLVGAIKETSDLEAQQMLDTNFLGSLRVIRNLLPQIRQQKSGHIINYSAIGGFTGF